MTDTITQTLRELFPAAAVSAVLGERGILTLSGECEDWDALVAIGHKAAKLPGVKRVVNDMTVRGFETPRKDYAPLKAAGLAKGEAARCDVLIVGAGITGCGIARELAKYDLDVIVAEKDEDVAAGATKANNGQIHPGYAVKPGTLKAALNVKGNAMYDKWAAELGFELDRCGSVYGITSEAGMAELQLGLKVSQINGVPGVEIVDGARALELEPRFAEHGYRPIAALTFPTYAAVEPYKVTVALAENAAANGVRFMFACPVADILVEGGRVAGAVTGCGVIRAKYVINCAGVYADEISAMAGDRCYTIHPRRGAIAILDKNRRPMYGGFSAMQGHTGVQNKNEESKGGGMCRTVELNVLMGPSATETPYKDDLGVTAEDLAYAMGKIDDTSQITYGDIIRVFSGVRPADYTEDFIIEESPVTGGFINVGAIQSPGLSAAPAIAEMVEGILKEAAERRGEPLAPKAGWQPIRRKEAEFRRLSREEQDALIQKDPRYGRIVCRCETITEGEIIDAVRSPVVPVSIDAIKRRTRAGMGRCQGGFCQPRVLEILARELGREWTDINLRGEGSAILLKDNLAKEAGQ